MNRLLNVLVVEDSPLAAEAILRALREAGYELGSRVVDNPGALAEALAAQAWDVVLCDYLMATFNGMDALAIFHQHNCDCPFVCVSGEIGDEAAAEIIRAGAHAFLSKSHLPRLGAVVERELAAGTVRQHQRRVAELASHLATIVEGSSDAILSRKLDGTILSWNRAAETTFGFTAEEAVGQNVSILFPPEKLHELPNIFAKLTRGERIELMVTTRWRKDRTLLDISQSISPIRDGLGQVVGVSTILRDITERRRMEQERQNLIEKLQNTLAKVKQLSGLLPICAHCKRIRDDKGDWQQVEVYVHEHSQADFSHGICPECTKQLYPDIYERMNKP